MTDDLTLKKIMRIASMLTKGTAMGVEVAREVQMLKKEFDGENVDVISFNENKSIYDVSLYLKQLSRQRYSGNKLKDVLDAIDTGVSIWKASEERKRRRFKKRVG